MIVWGGANGSGALSTGGKYNPVTDIWTPMTTTGAPAVRYYHTAVWTGSEMIVWGGRNHFSVCFDLGSGGKYNPVTDSWTPTSSTNAPAAREFHTAIWTGSEMVVWGGHFYACTVPFAETDLNSGAKYDPATDSWTTTSTSNAPTARTAHTGVWTGSEMIIWGGAPTSSTGARYNPGTDTWTATETTGAPAARNSHTAVWTGNQMIVWGGFNNVNVRINTGGRYDPVTNSWTATSTTNAPAPRNLHTAVWTGNEMIVWGGYDGTNNLATGGRYCAPSPTFIISGTVSYCIGTARLVPGVTITLNGDAGGCTQSDANADYSISAVTNGNYTVTPSLPNIDPLAMGHNITSVESLRVIQHINNTGPGTLPPNSCALAATRANSNNMGPDPNASDALAITQWIRNDSPLPANVRTGQWRFNPAQRDYMPLNGNQSAQNYDAYVIGDPLGQAWNMGFPSQPPCMASAPERSGAGIFRSGAGRRSNQSVQR
jgi:N-acetylneuraminic acid mutarotase